ncbi:MAG: hypothetical protein LBQ36_02325 [Synergistaceae bacterium]|jgi:hypothetical protein|nr:hypothetical protein [Synergistaceae bacterium]
MRKTIACFFASFVCAFFAAESFAAVGADVFFRMMDENDASGVRLAILDGFDINAVYGKRAGEKTPLLEAIKETLI